MAHYVCSGSYSRCAGRCRRKKPAGEIMAEELEGHVQVHIKILGALHFFDSGSYQTADDGDSVISLSQPSMSRAIEEVTSAIVELLASDYIRFPRTVEEKCRTMREFQEKNNMPNELGALDGTHIAIFKPDSNDPIAPGNLIYNRKEYYSINCL
ncbi:hypothetical protein O0L34_g4631 [Tuta absoluta]|nr:hypothetical protein O0L34_g10291 [Tuta absoluta]KAJ2952346.1 hypothetical protein O0L34_g4631 [Tuta absoluta]